MRSKIAFVLAALALITATQASAQFGGLLSKALGLPGNGEAGGTYQSNNQIRTYISARPFDEIDLYDKVIVKAAEMTGAKGFPRFGVTKVNCSMMMMNGSPVSKTCYVIAVMLNEGEETKPRGKRPVQYYLVSEVQAGVVAPPVQQSED